jgi:hypothetical protein
MMPKVFGDLLPRFESTKDSYTAVYRLPPRKFDSAEMGVVEFKGNKLPQLLSSEQKHEHSREHLDVMKWKMESIPWKGTPV